MYVGIYFNIGLIALLIIAIIISLIIFFKSNSIGVDLSVAGIIIFLIIIIICTGFIKVEREKIIKAKYAVTIINKEYNTQFTQEEYFFNQKLIEQIIKDKKNVTDESL